MGFHTNSLRAQEIPVPAQKRRVLTQHSTSLHSLTKKESYTVLLLNFQWADSIVYSTPKCPNSAHETKCSGYSSQKHNSCHHSASANATLCEKSRTQMPQVKILIHSWHGSQWPTKVRHMLVSLHFFFSFSSPESISRCFLFSFLFFTLQLGHSGYLLTLTQTPCRCPSHAVHPISRDARMIRRWQGMTEKWAQWPKMVR